MIDLNNIDFQTVEFQTHPLDITRTENIIQAQINTAQQNQ